MIASLCDSRTCNQSGGGEHIKQDIEDFFLMLPTRADDANRYSEHKVALVTCMGMCNRSPNLLLQSKSSNLVKPGGKLVNDGGLRLGLEEDELDKDNGDEDVDDESGNDDDDDEHSDDDIDNENSDVAEHAASEARSSTSRSKRVIIHEISLEKLAHAIGFENTDLINASQCQMAGKKSVLVNSHNDALQHFVQGLVYCRMQEEELLQRCADDEECERTSDTIESSCRAISVTATDELRSTRHLQASLLFWFATANLEWVRANNTDEHIDVNITSKLSISQRTTLLQYAAHGVWRILKSSIDEEALGVSSIVASSNTVDSPLPSSASSSPIYDFIDELLSCAAGVEMEAASTQLYSCLEKEDDLSQSIDFKNLKREAEGEQDHATLAFPDNPCTTDVKLLVNCIVVLAGVWGILSGQDNVTDIQARCWRYGALIAYKGALAVAAAPAYGKLRIFRAKAKRRIKSAVSDLSQSM
jgi:hypothetical protein